MEAPEKVYFTSIEDGTHYYTEAIPFEREYVEYVSKDAFIEKAIGWIDYNNRNGGCNFDGWEKDFKQFMKGE